jgi:hypothetical protein
MLTTFLTIALQFIVAFAPWALLVVVGLSGWLLALYVDERTRRLRLEAYTEKCLAVQKAMDNVRLLRTGRYFSRSVSSALRMVEHKFAQLSGKSAQATNAELFRWSTELEALRREIERCINHKVDTEESLADRDALEQDLERAAAAREFDLSRIQKAYDLEQMYQQAAHQSRIESANAEWDAYVAEVRNSQMLLSRQFAN